MSEVNLKKNSYDFTLGADPEFTCVSVRGEVINARDEVGGSSGSSEFGADGHGTTFEIRPKPAMDPLKLVGNIRKIFTDKVEEKPKFLKWNWFAGSYKYNQNLGGHIHFGIPKDKIQARTATEVLSQYVGSINLLIEDTKEAKTRRGSYGGYADFRQEHTWGFEYRTLSSWLVSPVITTANLCLSKVVAWELMNNKNFRPGSYVNEFTFRNVTVNDVAQNFPKIWDDITKMQLYPKYKQYIDVLYYLVVKKLTWFPKGDMKAAWGLVDTRSIAREGMNLDTIWTPYVEKKPIITNVTYARPAVAEFSF